MDLELTPIQKEISELILETTAPGKHSARSAIRHIQKSWEIREIDPNMAVFRAITGQEEAATAIFHALKRHRYTEANSLNPYNHYQKASVAPFLTIIGRGLLISLREADLNPEILIKETGKPRIALRITVILPDGKKVYAYPEPPLNWKLEMNGKPYDFKKEIESLATEKNAKDITRYIADLANRRNRILYASREGVPEVQGNIESFLLRKKEEIFRSLLIFLLIDPYKEKQIFVQQVIKSFLKTLQRVPKTALI